MGEETKARRRRLCMWRVTWVTKRRGRVAVIEGQGGGERGGGEAGARCRRRHCRRSHVVHIVVVGACGGTTRGRGAAIIGDVSSLPVLVNLPHCERNQVDAGTGMAMAQPRREHG